jgi:hypothetical protein
MCLSIERDEKMRKSVWLLLPLTLAATHVPTNASGAVEYVKVCSLYGAGWFYLPGTDTCLNADTGETRTQTDLPSPTGSGTIYGVTTLGGRVGALEGNVPALQGNVANLAGETAALRAAQQQLQARFDADFRNANDGSAIAMALEDPYLTESEHFGFKVNWGNYLSSNALGVTFAGVLAEHGGSRLTLSGGVAFTGSNLGGHAGVQFSW